jgi:hypothetical protein
LHSYCVNLNSDTGTGDNVWVELVPASGTQVAIYKIVAGHSTTPSTSTRGRLRVFRETTAATGTGVGTIVEMNPSASASSTTANIKQPAIFAGTGTTTDNLLDITFNDRQSFEWIASSPNNWLWSGVAERITVRLLCTIDMGSVSMSVYFKE